MQREWLTFIVVGGGATGVELAGAISEVAFHSLTRDFRRIDPRQARVLLLEGTPHILGSYPEVLQKRRASSSAQLGVQVHVDARVTAIDECGVVVHYKSARSASPRAPSCGARAWRRRRWPRRSACRSTRPAACW